MKKAILSLIGSGVFLVALVFSMNTSTVTFGEQAFADGTCCEQSGSFCVIGSTVVNDAYHQGSGPCPIIIAE